MKIHVHSMSDLLSKIEAVAEQQNATHVKRIAVRFGKNSFISPDKFRDHFSEISVGSVAEGCRLVLQFVEADEDPGASDILLVAVDLN